MSIRLPLIRRFLFVLLIAAMMAPLVEAFDFRDNPGLTKDTDYQLAALAMVAGLFSAVAFIAIKAHRALSHHVELCRQVKDRSFTGSTRSLVFHGCSPRVPLRI